MAFLRYPQFPRVPNLNPIQQRTLEEWAASLILELETRDKSTLFGAANATPFVLTSTSVQRSLNVQTATTSTVAAVLGTLIADFKAHGDLS